MPTADLIPTPAAPVPPTTTVASGTLNFNSSGVLTSTEPTGDGYRNCRRQASHSPFPPAATTFADGAAAMPSLGTWRPQALPPSPRRLRQARPVPPARMASPAARSPPTPCSRTDHRRHFLQRADTCFGTGCGRFLFQQPGTCRIGNNNYQASAASGAAVVGLAGTGGRGTIIGGSVEQSNVNIATEFAKLIVAQQAYSANAKSITTFNQVSQATIAMLQ